MSTQTFTVNEFLTTFKVGRTLAYEEIKRGRLQTYKLGRKRLISAHAAEAWQRRLEAETSTANAQAAAA